MFNWLEVQLAIVEAGLTTVDEILLPYLQVNRRQTLYQFMQQTHLALPHPTSDLIDVGPSWPSSPGRSLRPSASCSCVAGILPAFRARVLPLSCNSVKQSHQTRGIETNQSATAGVACSYGSRSVKHPGQGPCPQCHPPCPSTPSSRRHGQGVPLRVACLAARWTLGADAGTKPLRPLSRVVGTILAHLPAPPSGPTASCECVAGIPAGATIQATPCPWRVTQLSRPRAEDGRCVIHAPTPGRWAPATAALYTAGSGVTSPLGASTPSPPAQAVTAAVTPPVAACRLRECHARPGRLATSTVHPGPRRRRPRPPNIMGGLAGDGKRRVASLPDSTLRVWRVKGRRRRGQAIAFNARRRADGQLTLASRRPVQPASSPRSRANSPRDQPRHPLLRPEADRRSRPSNIATAPGRRGALRACRHLPVDAPDGSTAARLTSTIS